MVNTLLYVYSSDKWQLVDLTENTSLSISYTLNNESDPCSFTSPYSTPFTLPLSDNNNRIFDFPHFPVSSRKHYQYKLYSNRLLQTGILIVDTVENGVITANIFAEQVSLNEKLGKPNEDKETTTTLKDYDYNGTYLKTDGTTIDQTTSIQFNSSNLIQHDGFITHPDFKNFLYFAPAYLGVPKEITADKVWDGSSLIDANRGDMTVLSAPAYIDPNNNEYYQYRNYHLTPILPLKVLFNNVLNKNHNKSNYNVTVSDAVNALIHRIGITCKPINEINEEFKDLVKWYGTSGESHSTSESLSPIQSYRFFVKPYKPQPSTAYFGSWATTSVGVYYLITLSCGSYTHKTLIYPNRNGYRWHDFKDYFPGITFDEVTTWDGFNSGSTWTRCSETGVVSFTLDSYIVSLGPSNKVIIGKETHTNCFTTFTRTDDDTYETQKFEGSAWQLQVKALGNKRNIVSVSDIIDSIEDPWGIIKKVCKKYNIRIKQTDVNSFKLCLTNDYYSGSYDLTNFIDKSNYSIQDYLFNAKHLIFKDEPIDSAALKSYSDEQDMIYGAGKVYTGYPIASNKDWMSNALNYGISVCEDFYPYSDTTKILTTNPIFEACDDDAQQIDHVGCLVSLIQGNNLIHITLYDDYPNNDPTLSEQEQAYYLCTNDEELAKFSGKYKQFYCNTLCTAPNNTELFLYGDLKKLPKGITGSTSILTNYFTDVIDSSASRLCTTNVLLSQFLLKNQKTIYDFLTGLYYFDNAQWVVNSLSAYDILSAKPTEVQFVKVADIYNYFPKTYELDITATANSIYLEFVGKGSYIVEPDTSEVLYVNLYDKVILSHGDEGIHNSWTIDGTTIISDTYTIEAVSSDMTIVENSTAVVKYNSTLIYDNTVSSGQLIVDGSPTASPAQSLPGTPITFSCIPNTNYQVNHWECSGFNPYSFLTPGKRVNWDGTLVDDALCSASDWIEVNGGEHITWNWAYNNAWSAGMEIRLCEYDSSKTCLQQTEGRTGTSLDITLSNLSRYIRVTVITSKAGEAYVYDNTNLKYLEQGNKGTSISTTQPSNDISAKCVVTRIQHVINVSATNGTCTGWGTINQGDTCTLTFTPDTGYTELPEWTGLPSYATLSADHLTATFVVQEPLNISVTGVAELHSILTFGAAFGTITSVKQNGSVLTPTSLTTYEVLKSSPIQVAFTAIEGYKQSAPTWTWTPSQTVTYSSPSTGVYVATLTLATDASLNVTGNPDPTAVFTKLYAPYNYYQTEDDPSAASTLWDTTKYIEMPIYKSSIGIFVDTAEGTAVSATTTGTGMSVTKISDSFFILSSNYIRSVSTPNTVTFSSNGETRTYRIRFTSHHLPAYVVNDISTTSIINDDDVRGAIVKEVSKVGDSFTLKLYLNPQTSETTATSSTYPYRYGNAFPVAFAANNKTAKIVNARTGDLLTCGDSFGNTIEDTLDGTDLYHVSFNTMSPTITIVPTTDPDCHELTVSVDPNTTGETLYYLIQLPTLQMASPCLLYQQSL